MKVGAKYSESRGLVAKGAVPGSVLVSDNEYYVNLDVARPPPHPRNLTPTPRVLPSDAARDLQTESRLVDRRIHRLRPRS